MPPFAAGFQAGAAMYMPAFTQLGGVPMHMNAAANDRLRRLLGGDGAVSIGDHTADTELIEHGVAGDVCDAALKTFLGGLHISLQGGTYWACLPDLVRDGLVSREAVEGAGDRGAAPEAGAGPLRGSAALRPARGDRTSG